MQNQKNQSKNNLWKWTKNLSINDVTILLRCISHTWRASFGMCYVIYGLPLTDILWIIVFAPPFAISVQINKYVNKVFFLGPVQPFGSIKLWRHLWKIACNFLTSLHGRTADSARQGQGNEMFIFFALHKNELWVVCAFMSLRELFC